ncbi:MAG TPA: hypothetical protein VKT29_08900 [Terriglobales bacterium]|nr:hypothetical protein [Terriglobales bacterium]
MPKQTKATSADAQIVLQLYDFRREPEMRKARNFIANFWPQSADDIINLAMAWGTPENAWMRQVFTYWDMAACLALRGSLNPGLAFDSLGEMWFVYAKVKPFLKEFRQKMNAPESFANIEKFIEGTPEGRQRLKLMQERLAKFAERLAKAKAAD